MFFPVPELFHHKQEQGERRQYDQQPEQKIHIDTQESFEHARRNGKNEIDADHGADEKPDRGSYRFFLRRRRLARHRGSPRPGCRRGFREMAVIGPARIDAASGVDA